MATAYIGLGSNLGNREANLRGALRAMTRMCRVEAVSALYETDPAGAPGPEFYNAACRIETGLEPRPLLRFLKAIEHEIGRRLGGAPNAPRPIDLDILLYEDRVVEEESLTIPHPRLAERAFALVPLAEIAADVAHPVLGTTVGQLARAADASGVRRVAEGGWDGVAGREQQVTL